MIDVMKKFNIRWQLVIYDAAILLMAEILLMLFYRKEPMPLSAVIVQATVTFICVIGVRILGGVYHQIWRYGGIQCYIRLLYTDAIAFVVNLVTENLLPIDHIAADRLLAIICMNLLGCLAIRMFYRYAYKCGNTKTVMGRVLLFALRIFAGKKIECEISDARLKVNIAIIGAGRVGVALAEELFNNTSTRYCPRCFVDINKKKANRIIHGIPVLLEHELIFGRLKELEVQEVVFALPNLSDEAKKQCYQRYASAGFKIKVYDYPIMQTAGSKRALRDFDIDELLFRKPTLLQDDQTAAYYRDKVILITGGGGSIGSELCRQLAKMQPKQIIILDICENGAYDIQQELKIIYKEELDLQLEIASITNQRAMDQIFRRYRPQIVINAAAISMCP